MINRILIQRNYEARRNVRRIIIAVSGLLYKLRFFELNQLISTEAEEKECTSLRQNILTRFC